MEFELLGLSIHVAIIWMVIAIGFVVAEGFTLGLTFIWFAGGALLAMIVSLVTDIITLQVLAFIIGSAAMLYFTRPVAIKIFKIGSTKTNVDSLIGKEGVVIKELSMFSMGQVKIKGQIWSAKPNEDITISEGTHVEVVRIDGVKLIVKPE